FANTNSKQAPNKCFMIFPQQKIKLKYAVIPRAGNGKSNAWVLNIQEQPAIVIAGATGFRTDIIASINTASSSREFAVHNSSISLTQHHIVAAKFKYFAGLAQAHQARNTTAIFTQQNTAAWADSHIV